jgi:hypothetical protein
VKAGSIAGTLPSNERDNHPDGARTVKTIDDASTPEMKD